MDSGCCGNDEHFLFGTLRIRVTRLKSGRPAPGVRLCIGVTEHEALRVTCRARHALTNAHGLCQLQFPIGKAVIALPSKKLHVAWVTLDQHVEVELQV